MQPRTQLLLIFAFGIAAIYLSLGVFVLVNRPRQPIARVFALICLAYAGIYTLNLFQVVPDALNISHTDLPVRLRWALFSLSPALYFHLAWFYFPPSWRNWSRTVLVSVYAVGVASAALAVFTSWIVTGPAFRETFIATAEHGPLMPYFWVLLAVSLGISTAGLISNFRRSRSTILRQQIAFLLLPIALLVLGTLLFGGREGGRTASAIHHEVAQALVIVTALLHGRAVMTYGSFVGRPMNMRGFLLTIALVIIAAATLTGLLAADAKLAHYTPFPLPVLTSLTLIAVGLSYAKLQRTLTAFMARFDTPQPAILDVQERTLLEDTANLSASQLAARFLQTVCEAFYAGGGFIVWELEDDRGVVEAAWQLPQVQAGAVVTLPSLPLRGPHLIADLWSQVANAPLWQQMALICPLQVGEQSGALVLGEKSDGRFFNYREVEACARLVSGYGHVGSVARASRTQRDGPALLSEGRRGLAVPGPATVQRIRHHDTDFPVAVYALRALEVWRFDERVAMSEWGSEKARGMLAYLIWKHPEGATREELCAALWPEKEPEDAANVFHVTVHRLRRVLEPARRRGSSYVVHEHGRYRFNRQAPHWLDVDAFERLAAAGDEPTLRQAIALYRAGYLEDVAWALPAEAEIERRRLERLMERALRQLVQLLPAGSRETELQQLLQLVPSDEFAHQTLLADYLLANRLDLAREHMKALRSLKTIS